MDEFAKMMLLMGKGMWGGTKLMLGGVSSLLTRASGNTPEQRNIKKRGVVEYKPSEIGGFFPASEVPENTVISGGDARIRAEAVGAFSMLAAHHQLPVVILHCGNRELEQYMLDLFSGTGLIGIINGMNPCYEPFWQKTSREISQMIMESAPKDFEMKMSQRTYLEGMCAFLAAKGIRPSYHLMSTCPHGQMFLKIDEAIMQGKMDQAKGQQIKMRLMAGQSEYYKIENYFYDLEAQIQDILWKRQPIIPGQSMPPVNILSTLGNRGILLVDVVSTANQLLLNLMLSELRLAVQKGMTLCCVLDSLEVSDNEYLRRMIEQNADRCRLAICSRDIYASVNADDKLFNVILGKSRKNIIFTHSSNVSATKWSEVIGSYDKEEISRSYSKSKSYSPIQFFPTTTSGENTNISIKREYIVKPEEILRMQKREVYIYSRAVNEFAHTMLV